MSTDPAVDEWRKQLELGVGNNPNSRLLRFTEGAINPVIKKEGGQIPKANLGRIVKASESAFNPNLLRTINTLSKDINNAPALNFLANKYLRGIGREVQIPEILGGNNFELPGLDLGNIQSLLQRTPMLESDFLTQYGGYNPIIHELGLPIVTGGLTGHKSSFQNFDKAFRGSGMGNQNGGIYFTSQPEFASEVGRRNSLGGYGFSPNPQTFTPFVSETLFSNPDKFLDFTGPISADVAKKIGTINGVNAADYTDFNEFIIDLQHSFNPNMEGDLVQYSQRQAADALREKGFTGHIYNGDETVVYDESDLRKIKEFELYKDLDDALIMSYLQAISKNASQQSAAEAQLVKAFEEYMRTGDKSKLVNRKFGGALPKAQIGQVIKSLSKLTPGNAIRAGIYSSISPVGYSSVDKLKGVPFELWRNATDNGTRPFRVGMSLKHGVDELQADMLKKVGYDLAQWNKLPVKEQMDIIGSSYGKDHLERLQDIGRRRLDAWAVGLKRPQEYNTLEQIGDNTFKMVGTEYTPMYFNSLLNDLKAKQIENDNGFYTGQFSPLERLSRDQYRVKLNTLFEPAGADYELRQKDLIGYRDWDRTRQVDLEPQGLTSNHPTGTIYDNDMYGVMGGFNWKLMEHPEGMQFQTNDLWDLNPFEKRLDTQVGYNPLRQKYLDMHYYKPFQNFEVLRAVNGKPFNIQNNFLVDPKTFQTVRQWRDGGPLIETEGNPEEPVTDCPDGYIYDSDKLGCVPISNTVLDPAQQHISNWWMNREINWPENNEDYKKKMQQILPSSNPNSPVIGQLNDWPGYVYTDDLPRPDAGGMYDTNKKKPRIFVRKSYGPEMRLQTGIHEGTTHANAAVANDLYPMHNKIMKENLIPMNKDWSPEQKEFYSYVTAPDEDNYHSYLMNARKIFNVDPKQVVTEDDINKWRQQAEESGMMDREGPNYNEEIYLLFKLAKNPAALTNIFNYMAENKNQSAEEVPQYTKFGGETEYELGDVVNEHTKRELEKLGYTFEQIK